MLALMQVPALAQGTVTIPPDAIGRDGGGVGSLAGATAPRRQQFLLGASLLTGMRGRTITRLAFRRDGQLVELAAGLADLTLRLDQQTVVDPWRASTSFAANLGVAATVAFAGRVSLPSSPRPNSRDGVGFGPNETVTIDLARPFIYLGGTLCIDIEGAPVGTATSRAWPLDIDRDGVRGRLTTNGSSCVATPEAVTRHASADPSALRPGATARFVGFGHASQPAGLLLAPTPLSVPVDLTFLGSPGCTLGLLPAVELWTSTAANRRGPLSAANVYLTVPHETRFASAILYAQWLFIQDGRIRTTETLAAELAGAMASIDGAMVTSLPRAGEHSGEVVVSAVPAIQITWQ